MTKEIEEVLASKNKMYNFNLKKEDYIFATKLIFTYLWEFKNVKTFDEFKKEINEFYNSSGFLSRESPILMFLLTNEGTFQETETGKLFRSNFCSLKQHVLKGTTSMLVDAESIWPLVEPLFLKEIRKDDSIIFQEIIEKRRSGEGE